jgi:hypothetical protein
MAERMKKKAKDKDKDFVVSGPPPWHVVPRPTRREAWRARHIPLSSYYESVIVIVQTSKHSDVHNVTV